jgi:hypothetical protein
MRHAIGAVALLVAVVVRNLRLPHLMHIATGYAALQILSIRPGDLQVTSHVIGLFNATARYERGFGCSLRDECGG